MRSVLQRIKTAVLAIPTLQDYRDCLVLLGLYGAIYLPIGFSLGLLRFAPQTSWVTIVGVGLSAFVMPGLTEEFCFRVLLIPHPREVCPTRTRLFWIALSWLLFLLYHLHPFVPAFFRTPAFLIGAGLLGLLCTISYLRSGSFWTPVLLHWAIVTTWLLGFGGLEQFRG